MNISNSDEIKIKLSTTSQSGIIAALHLIANKFGVKVKDSLVSRVSRERNRAVVIFEGTLNVSQTEFTDAIESHPRIYSIDEIEVKSNLKIYAEDEYKSDTPDFAEDDTDFESIVKEVEEDEFESIVKKVEDVEFESYSKANETSINIFSYDDLEPDQNIDTDEFTNSESLNTEDIQVKENNSKTEFSKVTYKFNANDNLTEEALETTEQIFQDLLGPVASLFISTAVIEANTIGELFIILSEELDGEVKMNFLALVKDLDKSQIDFS